MAVSAAFGSLGRAFVCADIDFRIIHGSYVLDEVFGPGAAASIEAHSLESVFGAELFGLSGSMRQALAGGERREGWRTSVRIGASDPRLMSLSAAPFPQDLSLPCSHRVKYIIVLRPYERDQEEVDGAPRSFGGVIARSPAMARIFTLVDHLAHAEATVLITGESGTGKELVARLIHEQSPRRNGPFVAVNCGALPLELLEAEMFGHVRGAFTGAVRDRVGRCEAASEGTLFLDEIGDLPLPLQVKLLRFLQDGSFQRLGENQPRVSRARVVAATHVNLGRAVREGRFREDLYYRLRVVPIEIPPLRKRREDIEPLAGGLLGRVGSRHGRSLRFSPDALRVLLAHDWPGNVRELENVIEYAVTVCRGQTVLPEDLPALDGPGTPGAGDGPVRPGVHRMRARAAESDDAVQLRAVLEAHQWRRADAARALGISRVTLWRRMQSLGMLGHET
jgi:DNA-binding NtrC family response regulator